MDSPGLCWVLLLEKILITPFPLMSSFFPYFPTSDQLWRAGE